MYVSRSFLPKAVAEDTVLKGVHWLKTGYLRSCYRIRGRNVSRPICFGVPRTGTGYGINPRRI